MGYHDPYRDVGSQVGSGDMDLDEAFQYATTLKRGSQVVIETAISRFHEEMLETDVLSFMYIWYSRNILLRQTRTYGVFEHVHCGHYVLFLFERCKIFRTQGPGPENTNLV